MKKHHFFAMMSRMKYINRWSLMRNAHTENLSEHSLETAAVAHALAVLHNRRFGGNVNVERAALLGLYHDLPESLTGDLPTPVKYQNEDLRKAYKQVEKSAGKTLLNMLPEDIRSDYIPIFIKHEEDLKLWEFVKAADKICALSKCIDEKKAGNSEFDMAAKSIEKTIKDMNLPEARCFIDEFLPSFSLTLDEIKSEE
ncbi:MAG TPA: 5'-deoxynucleotidase [Clostridiales bacterium]|nr:5'-deoxynucleotidase [Clostridiales bacterium]HRT81917.1 5'-deoxynucleotidase [Oscillospiraceae bacterium]